MCHCDVCYLHVGKIEVTFRTSDENRFPGFKATVTCVDPNTATSKFYSIYYKL